MKTRKASPRTTRRRRELPAVTNQSYGWWICAQRPPFDWFMGLPEEEQLALAKLGEEYVQDVCVAIGTAVANPMAAEAGLEAASNPAAEGDLLSQVAAATVRKLMGTGPTPTRPPMGKPTPQTMGGAGARRVEADAVKVKRRDSHRTFLGRAPT
jgi:hypothetical protein